uniref:Putative lipocalin-3 1 n=1 Tax=Amblyomma parvum TaxID=251391 RepID=A0A023G125_AMBPA
MLEQTIKLMILLPPVFIGFAISFLQQGLAHYSRTEDAAEFMNTSEKIIVYNSTDMSGVSCKVDAAGSVHKDKGNVSFNRTVYTTSGKNTTDCLFATVYGDTMYVGLCNETQDNTTEILLYQNGNCTCGVFDVAFSDTFSGWYELRVRASSLDSGPSNDCAEYFAKRTEDENQTVYTGSATALPACL